jgi:hypothetical protein
MTFDRVDRLYSLLPQEILRADAEEGQPLRALLGSMGVQAKILEDDAGRLERNWFIETCDDWVVSYIGDLVGYELVAGAQPPAGTLVSDQLMRVLAPRREVGNTVRFRRRRGTARVLEEIGPAASGWLTRAVELRQCSVVLPDAGLGTPGAALPNARNLVALDEAAGPFDVQPRLADARRFNSTLTPGLGQPSALALWVWRMKTFAVTRAPALSIDGTPFDHRTSTAHRTRCHKLQVFRYTFSPLSNPVVLVRPADSHPAANRLGRNDVMRPVTLLDLERDPVDVYGPDRALAVWVSGPDGGFAQGAPPAPVVAADLSTWAFIPPVGAVAVDPRLGRIVVRTADLPKPMVEVRYHYASAAPFGGGSYHRRLTPVDPGQEVHVSAQYVAGAAPGRFASVAAALEACTAQKRTVSVITIDDDGIYEGDLHLAISPGQRVEVRAAEGRRPTIRLGPNGWSIVGAPGALSLVLDGLLIAGGALQVQGALAALVIRQSTLVPGRELDTEGRPLLPQSSSVELHEFVGAVSLKHSICGAIEVYCADRRAEPPSVEIDDSVLDDAGSGCPVLAGPGCAVAYIALSATRTTFLGSMHVQSIRRVEDCLLYRAVVVAHRQRGEVRSSYVQPHSKVPERCDCQPDRAIALALADAVQCAGRPLTSDEINQISKRINHVVVPRFKDIHFGTASYARLDEACPDAIRTAAADASEPGVYHNLFEPQRTAKLRARLAEFTPAGTESRLIFAD